MSNKAKIKVIKKKEVQSAKAPPPVVKETKQAAAREMVSTVSNWVSEFQNRKREETNQAISKLFSSRPQASGA